MIFLPKSAFPLMLSVATAVVLALSGCQSGQAASQAAGTTQASAPDASDPTSQATASTSQASSGNTHACSLITQPEATTALGADPGPGQETSGGVPGVGNCVYGAVTGAGVRLFVDTSGVGKAIYDGQRSSYPGSQVTDVPGVGDGAFLITSSDSQVTLCFYKGGTFVSITLDTDATTGPLKDKVIALATTAAGRA